MISVIFKNYLTIGQLSLFSGLHVKALRYYEKIGILKPRFIDDSNGYRYYSHADISYVKLIKLCADYDIPLKSFTDYLLADQSLDLASLIASAQDSITKKEEQIEKDKATLSHMQEQLAISRQLDQERNFHIEQAHEDYYLQAFEGDILSPSYYQAIAQALALLNEKEITYHDRIGLYYKESQAALTCYLAVKIKGHTQKCQDLQLLHLQHVHAHAQHINKDQVQKKMDKLRQQGYKQFLLLETFESPLHFSQPHLEIRYLLDTR